MLRFIVLVFMFTEFSLVSASHGIKIEVGSLLEFSKNLQLTSDGSYTNNVIGEYGDFFFDKKPGACRIVTLPSEGLRRLYVVTYFDYDDRNSNLVGLQHFVTIQAKEISSSGKNDSVAVSLRCWYNPSRYGDKLSESLFYSELLTPKVKVIRNPVVYTE